MNNKFNSILTLIIALFVTPQTARADFHVALEELQRKDGAAMMREVKSAVAANNDDGLLLFLNGLSIDFRNSKLELSASKLKADSESTKSSFESMLTEVQQKELLTLLDKVTSKSTLEAQYRLFTMRDFNIKLLPVLKELRSFRRFSELTKDEKDKYTQVVNEWNKVSTQYLESIANQGNVDAALELFSHYNATQVTPPQYSRDKAEKWLIKSAELGSPYAASILGFKYLHIQSEYYISHLGCDQPDRQIVCFAKNEKQGEYWLQEAAKAFDEDPTYFGMSHFAYEVGRYFETKGKAYNDDTLLKQAYLWYQLALNSPNSKRPLGRDLTASESLKSWMQSKPELGLPAWIISARKSRYEEMPVFSLLRRDYLQYQLSVYANGNVYLEFPIVYSGHVIKDKDRYMSVPVATVKEFTQKLYELGVDKWPINRGPFDERECMDDRGCDASDYLIALNSNSNRRLFYIGLSDFYGRREGGHIVKLTSEHKERKLKNIKQVLALVDAYFPTQKLICSLGGQELFENACIKNDLKQLAE